MVHYRNKLTMVMEVLIFFSNIVKRIHYTIQKKKSYLGKTINNSSKYLI